MNLLKEIANFYRFFWKTRQKEKEIVFYSEHEAYYYNFKGLLFELTGTKQRTVCYITSDINDPILKRPHSGVHTFYLKKLLPFFMAIVKCKIFVLTMTDLNKLHLKRSINPVQYVYVFHSPVSSHMIYLQGAFDYYDSILCVGPHHIEEIRKHEKLNNLPRKKLVKAGYYPLERIYSQYKVFSEGCSIEKTTVLIAPSWGDSNILESCGESLIQLLLENGYDVIVRPHPETVRRTPEIINKLTAKFNNHPNCTIERSIVTIESLLRSDILICDYSGVAIEYAFGTERPVLFLDVPCKIRNESYKKLDIEPLELSIRTKIGLIVSLKKIKTVPQCIEELLTDKLKYKEIIIQLRGKYIFSFGNSSKISTKHICDLLNP